MLLLYDIMRGVQKVFKLKLYLPMNNKWNFDFLQKSSLAFQNTYSSEFSMIQSETPFLIIVKFLLTASVFLNLTLEMNLKFMEQNKKLH